jgi:hypothetical protein
LPARLAGISVRIGNRTTTVDDTYQTHGDDEDSDYNIDRHENVVEPADGTIQVAHGIFDRKLFSMELAEWQDSSMQQQRSKADEDTHRHAISISSLEASPLLSLSNRANTARASSLVGKKRSMSSTKR